MFHDPDRIYTPEDLQMLRPAVFDGTDTIPNYLAGSLLQVPDVHKEDSVATLWPQAAFPEEDNPAGGGSDPMAESLSQMFPGASINGAPPAPPAPATPTNPFDAMVASLKDDNRDDLLSKAGLLVAAPEAAMDLDLHVEILDELTEMDEYQRARILVAAINEGSNEVTELQVVATLATPELDAFPKAVDLISRLTWPSSRTSAQRRNGLLPHEKTQMRDHEMMEDRINLMLMMGDPTDAVLEQALHIPGCIEDDTLVDLLADASPYLIQHWLLGDHTWTPTQGLLEALGKKLDQDTLLAVRKGYGELVEKGHDPSTPWVGHMARHLFLPNVHLTPLAATLVWARIQDVYGDETAAALALVCLAADSDSVVSL